MGSFQKMLEMMKAIGIYRLNGNGLIEAEMEVYAQQLDRLLEQAIQLSEYCFLDLAENPYGGRFEWLFGLPETQYPFRQGDLEKRQRNIRHMKDRLAIKNSDFHKSGVQRAISTFGLTVELEENFAEQKVIAAVVADEKLLATKTEKIEVIQAMLPCHATAEIIFF